MAKVIMRRSFLCANDVRKYIFIKNLKMISTHVFFCIEKVKMKILHNNWNIFDIIFFCNTNTYIYNVIKSDIHCI